MNNQKIVFICGHIKSGTSLLNNLLDGHPELLVFPEELFITSKFIRAKRKGKIEAKLVWDEFFNDVQIRRLSGGKQSGVFGNVDYSAFDGEQFESLCREYSENKDFIETEKGAYIEAIFKSFAQVQGLDAEEYIWVEKSPTNEYNFTDLFGYFPNSRFIALKRNPLEIYPSVKKKRDKEQINYGVDTFMSNWRPLVLLGKMLENSYPDRFKVVDFSDLIHDAPAVMREVSTYMGISYNSSLLKATKMGEKWLGNSMQSANDSNEIRKHEQTNSVDIPPVDVRFIETYKGSSLTGFFLFPVAGVRLLMKDPGRFFRLHFSKAWLRKRMKLSAF